GVSSSVNDMTRWMSMVLADGLHDGEQLIDPQALLPAITPQVVSARGTEPAMRSGFYGYGFNVGTTSGARTQLSHSGAFELGAGTNVVFLPSADVAIVALTNATPAGIPETLTAQFSDMVQFGEVREDWFALYGKAFEDMDKPVGSLVGQSRPENAA
ncbi:serine hydrolase, partial [Mycobacterium sp. ITM-2017-0098]